MFCADVVVHQLASGKSWSLSRKLVKISNNVSVGAPQGEALLARTIVLIIHKRGGRFLKRTMIPVRCLKWGIKAEAKTSWPCVKGLRRVQATKSAASSLDKKKKKAWP
jgi:hypothetical protein